ncbi:hypothetical protein [uncultured Winogradskyella sp.]|uniref:hypothetical protein n=1 Tax=uncultured Winogradskyella sp. TaxID=395353 RepID=UPI0030ED85A3
MATFIIFVSLIVGGFTFIIIRISISCMFWFSKKPNDKLYVFKTQFPYYMMALIGLSLIVIIKLDFTYSSLYYFLSTYFLALLIWNYKLKHCKRKYSTVKESIEQSQPKLP